MFELVTLNDVMNFGTGGTLQAFLMILSSYSLIGFNPLHQLIFWRYADPKNRQLHPLALVISSKKSLWPDSLRLLRKPEQVQT